MGSAGSKTIPARSGYIGSPVKYSFINIDYEMAFEMPNNNEPLVMNIENRPSRLDYRSLQKMSNRDHRMVSTFCMAQCVNADKNTKETIAESFIQGIFVPTNMDTVGGDLNINTCAVTNTAFSNEQSHSGLKFGVKSDVTGIIDNIQEIARSGGRVVSVEMIGLSAGGFETASITLAFAGRKQERASFKPTEKMFRRIMPVTMVPPRLSVDIFYETFSSTPPGKYIYLVVNVPMATLYDRVGPTTDVNWETTKRYFDDGWRLADVFVDSSSKVNVSRRSEMVRNSLWIFEKQSSENDTGIRVRYEVTLKEVIYNIQLKLKGCCNSGVNVKLDGCPWEQSLTANGIDGWELVRIIPTPDFRVYHGISRAFRMKSILVLQRRRPM